MQKLVILFFLLSFSCAAMARGHWSPLHLDHEKFVHWTAEDKKQFLVQVMQIVTDIEAQYKYQVTSQGFSWERYQKFTQVMEKIQGLLIQNAHAQSAQVAVELEKTAKEFTRLINSGGGKRCLYGGWVSEVVNDYCVHPSRLGTKHQQIVNAYPRDPGCKGSEKITCNPVIFGYKNAQAKSLFCVEAGLSKAHSSSVNCMEAALGATDKNPSGPKADSPDKRLENMARALSQNKEVFDKVHSFVMKTCVCNDDDNKLNARYLKYMRPHRTCYGMLNSIRKIHSHQECTLSTQPFAEKFFKEMEGFQFDLSRIDPGQKTSAFESEYQKLLEGQDIKNLCNGAPPVPEVSSPPPQAGSALKCQANCSPKTEEEGLECTISILNDKDEVLETRSEKIILKNKEEKLMVKLSESQEASECGNVQFPAEPATSSEEPEAEKKDDEEKTDGPPGLKLTSEPSGSQVKLSVTLNDKTEIMSNYTLIWFRKETGTLKFEEVRPKDAPASSLDGDGSDDKKEEEKLPSKTPELASGEFGKNTFTVTEPRKETEFKTCVKLVGPESTQEKCETIPKLDSADTKADEKKVETPAQSGFPNQGQRPIPPPRFKSDTSRMNIQ